MSRNLSAVVVDDHAFFRSTLTKYLSNLGTVEVRGEGEDGLEALALVEALAPRIVIMDISMPHMDGLQACRKIKSGHPETVVILYSMHDLDTFSEEDKMAADRCLSKEGLFEELPPVLMDVQRRLEAGGIL